MDIEEKEIKLVNVFIAIARYKMFIAKICGVAFVLSLIVALSLPNVYIGITKVLPPPKESGTSLTSILGQLGGGGALLSSAMGGNADLYIGILKSRSVEDAVIAELDLATVYKTKKPEDTRRKLENAITIQSGNKDGIITISASDKDPVRAAKIANALVEQLGRVSVRLNLTKASVERIFLGKRLALVKDDLKKAEEELRAFSQQHKMVQLDAQSKASIEAVARLKAELTAKEIQIAALRSYQTDENEEIKALLSAVHKMKSQLVALGNPETEGGGVPTIGSVPGLGLEYLRKMREFKTQETLFEQLTKQYELAKLGEAKDAPSLQIIDDAVVPTQKSKPKRSLVVALSVAVAFFASLLVIFFKEFFRNLPDEDQGLWEGLGRDLFSFRRPQQGHD